MNSRDDITLGVASAPLSAPATASPGALLAAARQKLGLSVGDIAAKLRMSVTQIDAMERGEYGKLPKGTFLRGFVRSYAKLVGLQPEDVLKALEATHADSRQPTIVVPTQNIKMSAPGEHYSNPKVRMFLALMLVLALISGGAYWWFQVRPGQVDGTGKLPIKAATETTSAPVPVIPPASTSTTTVESSSPAADSVSSANSATANAPAAPAQIPAPVPETPQPPLQQVAPLTQTNAPLAPAATTAPADIAKTPVPKGSGSLRFAFSGESWVEVVDASGKTLVSRRFQAGQSESVVGKLPVSVVIGNATVTSVQFNQVDFDLTPHTRVAVARFTLK